MINTEHVTQYIKSKELSWAPSTLKSERARLAAALDNLNMLTPQEHFLKLRERGYGPYSIKTLFIRIRHFTAETNMTEICCIYTNFMKQNQRLFKHAYTKERVNITYNEALKRINKIFQIPIRNKALQLLNSGMRFTESTTLKDGEVLSKGGKRRAVYGAAESTEKVSYGVLYNTLRKIGLKPHTLRKLAAQRLVERGADSAELMEYMGWNDISTASVYLQSAKRKDRINQLLGSL